MTQERIRKVHLLYGAATAVLILIMSVMLMVSCVTIYQSGDRPFSREIIAQALNDLAVPGCICLLAVIGGFLLRIILPLDQEKPRSVRESRDILLRFQPHFDQLPADARSEALRLRRLRKKYALIYICLSGAAFVYPVLYFADISHFGVTDITSDVMKAVAVLLFPLMLVFAAELWRRGRCEATYQKEIGLYKSNAVKPCKAENAAKPSKLTVTRFVIAAVCALLIILGIVNEGYVDVLGKAIKICTECIGLG